MSNHPSETQKLKQAVLEQRLRKRMASYREGLQQVGILVADRSQPLPLSLAQQRLWFLDQLDRAASVAYHMPAALRLLGDLDGAALQATLDRLVARHESLRTHFVARDGVAYQEMAAQDCGFALRHEDLSALPSDERETAVAAATREEAHAPFDLAHGPLIRGRLLRLTDKELVLLITQHHIVSDGWSLSILVREVGALYTAARRGEADTLPPLQIQYADYAQWQRHWLQGEELTRQVGFWKEHLAGAPELLTLPLDRPRPALQSHAGESVPLTIPAELTAGLRELSQRHGATLFMTLLSAWGLLLSRLSGQSDVVVGTPVANRQRREVEDLIGFFVNTLALRLRFDAPPSVSSLLTQVQETTLEAFAHQDLPFEQVVEAVQPQRSLSHNPIAQASFTWHNQPPVGELSLPGLNLVVLDTGFDGTQADLSLHLAEVDGALSGKCVFASALFDRSTIERWTGHFVRLLEGMVADPSAAVDTLPLLSEGERQQLLHGLNATAVTHPDDRLIHELFAQHAAARPEAVAVVLEDQSLSYGELDARANQLAHYLLDLGVRPDDRVAICMERSVELVVGVLGILKAGGAYLPLDPAYPSDRLQYLLQDGAPVALLTQADLEAQLPVGELPVLRMDVDFPVLARRLPVHDPAPRTPALTSRNLAYVIYTSGSTGLPKGVMVEHRGLTNLARAQSELFEVDAQSRVLQFASPSFDASVSELAMTLSRGACLCLAPRQALMPGEPLLATMHELAITHVTLPSAALVACGEATFPALRTLIVAGDACPPALTERWHDRVRFFNAYGPTETTVCATAQLCESEYEATVPIGRPIDNMRVYILDARGEPVPVGVEGEIFIGGTGVARGYLDRPELTAERFTRDPFLADQGARMYKTGDRGRWLADGTIEYLGRHDFQVKIRGFRIELGEIEAKLATCPGVREAVVLAREDVPGDRRLVAYVIAGENVTLQAAELRAALAAQLPDYMVPAAFVMLDALPVTVNGKLDRKALRAPEASALLTREYEPPRGPIEAAVADVWQELLHVPRVGRDDQFFELGGHSLLVVAMVERLRAQGLSGEVRAIFTAPALSDYAATLERDAAEEGAGIPSNPITPETVGITPEQLPLIALTQEEIDRIVATVPGGGANIQDIYPLLPLQEGMLFHHLLETEGDTYLSRDVIAFESRQRLDEFLEVLEQVIARHDILRTAMLWEGLSKPAQVVYRKVVLPLESIAVPEGRDAVEVLSDRTDPQNVRLNLRRAPLMAAYVAEDTARGEWLLSLLVHHLICDHVTLELVLAEVRALLRGEGDRLAAPMPLRTLVAQAGRVPLSEHEAYFRDQLGDVDAPTAPFGILDVQVKSTELETAGMRIDGVLASRLRECAGQLGVPASVLFHVAWAQVLALCTGRSDVVFGTVLSGRLQGAAGADRALGMLINTLPLRISLDADARQVVRQSYERMVALLAHELAPLSLAQRCSGVQPPLPLFTSSLNYRHSAHADGESAEDLWQPYGLRPISGARDLANFPLGLKVDDFDQHFEINAVCATGIGVARITAYLASALSVLVEALATGSDEPLARLDILPANERATLLETFHAVDADRVDGFAHEWFERQAEERPDALAVAFEGQTLSYAELNARANQLAHYLISLGIQPDDRVAICVERGPDMIVGLLGTLKAGAAYLPLDPAYPAERLQYMLDDAAPKVLLTQSETEAHLPAGDVPVLRLDVDLPVLARKQPTHNPDRLALGLTPDHLAYVIYTSGSTGLPKGVMVEHRSLCNMARAHAERFELTEDSRVLQFVSVAFDVCTAEVFMALTSGASLHLAQRHRLLPGQPLQTTLRELAITHVLLPVHVAAGCDPEDLPNLRHVIVGGDVCPPALVRRWHQRVRLFNAYGPTETSVCATLQPCEETYPDTVPIGRPFANARIFILDARQSLAPVGVAGDIHIGGVGVARGYLNRPELTEARFVRDPFSPEPHARMYKTGDRGRWLADGTIEYQGRDDFQVKIRGFRIELGEIEARLSACAGVREAVVIAREDEPGDKRLVAYFVAEAGSGVQAAELRAKLSAELPESMLPAAFVQLEALPLTTNGKPDRKALPAPEASASIAREYVEPQGEIEQTLAAIWQDLLKLPRVGRHDNFFELGGHSLMVVGLIERLREQGLALALADVFEQPTLMALAARVDRMEAGAHLDEPELAHSPIAMHSRRITPDLLPLADLTQAEIDSVVGTVPGGIDNVQDIYGLSPLQEGILFHHLIQEHGDPYASRMVLSFDGSDRLDAFLIALQGVIDRHDTLRTSFRWVGLAQPVQVVHRRETLAVEKIPSATPALPALLEATGLDRRRLDPQQAPLLAAFVAHEPNGGPSYLVLLYHHLIGDHLSMELLVTEAHAFLLGREAELLPPLAYRRFIEQGKQMSVQQHEDYFRESLGDVTEPTAPFGVIDTHGSGLEVGRTARTITGDLARRVRDAARRERLSPAVLFHAAWALVVGRLSGSDDVVFGSVLSGRQGIRGGERAVGMFINTLPLRVPLAGRGVQQVVRDTASRLAGLLEHEQAPLAWAQRASGVRPPLPLFTALLNYTHNTELDSEESAVRRASGIEMLQSETHNNFPLTMTVGDTGSDFVLIALTTAGVDGDLAGRCLQAALTMLLDKLEQDPECPFEHLSVLSPEMQSALLLLAQGKVEPRGRERMLPDAIADQAARTPEAVALRSGEVTLSYRELESRSNRLAQLLLEQGIGRGSRVGVHLGRSIELLIAQLAVMKTGAAYIPLDPTQTGERLASMIRDAGIAVVLLDSRHLRLPVLGIDTVYVDGAATDSDWLSDYPDEAPAIDLLADDTIYVLYTSGSTGEAKGVEVHHGGVIDYCAFARDNYYNDQLTGSLVATSPAFDLTLPALYVPLLCGGCVELLPEDHELDELSRSLANDAAPVLLRLTPSHVQGLLSLSDAAPRHAAHVFVIGGEVFEPALARRLQAKFPISRIYNHYGPTETVVGCAWFDVSANLDALASRIPIGRPMENTTLYVLDPQGRVQPAGVPGELYIGGAGVAKGYLNRPELTAEKFVVNPFGEGRLYRSGDQVRLRSDGELEFLGRVDRQVKLRGFRIELGEIESRLRQNEHVGEAVVRLWGEGDNAQLVAYLVPANHEATQDERQSAVHAQLSAHLPAYMLPAAYVWLDALPLTVNGKVDVQALPAPALSSIRAREYEPPQGEVEETMAVIWQELLKVPRVGRQDNFQLLGGHSLLMMQLVVRVREKFSVDLPLRKIFEASTLAELADMVVTAQLSRYSENEIAELNEDLGALSEQELQSLLSDSDGLVDGVVQ